MTKASTFDYENLVQESLRNVIKETLATVVKDGLPGKHHFYISFKTDYPGVDLPDYLREEYPDDITIVLQYEFWDLEVGEKTFNVTLCFNDVHERLTIPLGAVVSFVDPSVKFGLQFTPAEVDADAELVQLDNQKKTPKTVIERDEQANPGDGTNIITLDAFRRK
ncbi:SspB family protein [Candidatus Odyssella acanthamoebae]|uniref:Stringent starvation protein B n=1 Tax=Candidatus Odyssella acanthamoebae TaxID=91604 RepID=A0A077AZB8_9PROT|nr:ClpXP protease specificity-enhancing factor SspB [Candidatus Paracaedibacter acanthamoebae]AIK97008.1 hypothetical protein ID47_10110 [Candidatus Paracaedibacter acanthamoebae]